MGKRRGTHNEVKDIIDRHIIKLTGKRRREGDGGVGSEQSERLVQRKEGELQLRKAEWTAGSAQRREDTRET